MNVVETLLEKGLVTQQQMTKAIDLCRSPGYEGGIDRALIELGYIEEDEVLKLAGELLAIPLVDLTNIEIDPETISCMPSRLVHQKQLMPISRNNGTLRVATCDPYDLDAFDELRLMTGMQIDPVTTERVTAMVG